MSYQRDVAQVERLDHGSQISGETVIPAAAPGGARAAGAAPVVRDAAQALVGEVDHLVFPEVGAEGPGVDEDDGWARSPVPVEQARSVAGRDERARLAGRPLPGLGSGPLP